MLLPLTLSCKGVVTVYTTNSIQLAVFQEKVQKVSQQKVMMFRSTLLIAASVIGVAMDESEDKEAQTERKTEQKTAPTQMDQAIMFAAR
jgi:hypothetical protein